MCAAPHDCSSAQYQIINTPRITHGHVVSITPVQPPSGLFASPVWQDATAGKEFEVVVYNSLTVDPESGFGRFPRTETQVYQMS